MKKSTEKNQENNTAVKSEDIKEKPVSADSANTGLTRSEQIRRRAEASRQAALKKAVIQVS